jgi:hypothetical protein
MKHQTPLHDAEGKTHRQEGEWATPNFFNAPLHKEHLIFKKKGAYYMAGFS